MELPTYTSIWRIEKRLYKLYDFRLPMPLPVGQIAVFAAITVPYVILLTLFGLPFNHNLFWLYVLPPGLLTWLATRPVLESKRLPELIISQVRYVGEPSAWCRMTPHVEKDEIIVVGQVWRRGRPSRPSSLPSPRPSSLPSPRPQCPLPRRPPYPLPRWLPGPLARRPHCPLPRRPPGSVPCRPPPGRADGPTAGRLRPPCPDRRPAGSAFRPRSPVPAGHRWPGPPRPRLIPAVP